MTAHRPARRLPIDNANFVKSVAQGRPFEPADLIAKTLRDDLSLDRGEIFENASPRERVGAFGDISQPIFVLGHSGHLSSSASTYTLRHQFGVRKTKRRSRAVSDQDESRRQAHATRLGDAPDSVCPDTALAP